MRLTRTGLYDSLTAVALLGCAAGLIFFPKESVAAASDGLTLCLNVIIPSLFPFFVLSTMTVELGLAAKLGRRIEPLMRRLFRVSGVCSAAFILGFIGGYPVGAKTAIALYERGECSRDEAERLLSFCNNSGPAFILGVVGAGVFSDSRVGILLYLVHTVASVLTGICFRRWRGGRNGGKRLSARNAEQKRRIGFAAAFTGSVKNAFASTLNICGFVIFFTVILKLLFLSGMLPLAAKGLAWILAPLGLDSRDAQQLLTGIIELTSGVWSLSGAAETLGHGAAMAAFMLGWAGLSIHCQTLSFLCDSGLSAKSYLLGKLLQAVLSAVLVTLLFRLIPFEEAAAAYLARQVTDFSQLRFSAVLSLSLFCAGISALLLLGFSRISEKKVEKSKKI